MNLRFSECENEQIHFCGRVQSFGFLMIVDESMCVVAMSENDHGWLKGNTELFLGTPMRTFIKEYLPSYYDEVNVQIDLAMQGESRRQFIDLELKGRSFYLSIYSVDTYIYFEFELKQEPLKPWGTLYGYCKTIDSAGQAAWKALCAALHEILAYDRVMIYQFLEDQSGKVIAEQTSEGMEPYLHRRYPEFDIPKQARELYLKHHARLTADIHAPTSVIKSKVETLFDLTNTTIRALSPIHLEYLANAGAKASLSFSIIIDGKLWGLVACQNRNPQTVDLSKRYFGLFLTKYTVNSYLAVTKVRDLQTRERYKDFELMLKGKLLVESNVVDVINEFLEDLAHLASADGVAVIRKDKTFSFGSTPDRCTINKLHQYLNQCTRTRFYETCQFNLDHDRIDGIDTSSFTGLAKIDVLPSRDFSIIWFRDEYIYEEEWAGVPEKVMKLDDATNTYYPSPRTSFEAWKQSVRGTAIRWTENEVFFMKRIREVIRESLLRKSEEIKSLNEKLILLNNSLDTYAYTITHDLKNPLSAIKLSAQMMQYRKDMPPTVMEKISNNILESVKLMESLMSKVLEFSRAKVYEFEYETVDVFAIIHEIVDQNAQTYRVERSHVEIGHLLPIRGEKTLLYQLFLNVISNAIKYASKSQLPQIRIDSQLVDGFVQYNISDNGIGIAQNEVKDIYNMFKRMSNSSSFEGSGVGLAIVRRIADRLDIRIEVQTALGEGSTFSLFFPNDK